MKAASVLALIVSLSVVAESKVYTRCKLAKIFVKAGLDNFGGFSLGNCEIPPRLLARSTLAYENQPGGADLLHVPSLARLHSTVLLSRTCSPLSPFPHRPRFLIAGVLGSRSQGGKRTMSPPPPQCGRH